MQEFNDGFIDPDKSNHGSSRDSSSISYSTNNNPPTQLPTGTRQFSPASPIPSPTPGVATAATRRSAFKLTKSNTLCDEYPHISDAHNGRFTKRPYLTSKSPSFDVHGYDGKHGQSSISPLPSPLPFSNPDFELPTIRLTQNAPERKPLIQQSSSAFLSKLTTKTPRQYQLLASSKYRSVDFPQQVKSAPSSPNFLTKASLHTDMSYGHCDVSQISRDILEPVTTSILTQKIAEREESAGSCVAEQGESSDVASSGDMEEEEERVAVARGDGEEVGGAFFTGGLVQRRKDDSRYVCMYVVCSCAEVLIQVGSRHLMSRCT